MSSNPSPAVAAILSFLFPGAGQIYAGETRKGLIWAIPMLLFVVAVIVILLGGTGSMLGLVGTAPKRLALLVLNVGFFLYHLAATLDAYAVARRERYRGFGSSMTGAAPIVLAAVVSLTLILHGIPEVYGIQYHNAISQIAPDSPPPVIPSFTSRTPRPATPTPLTTPTPTTAASPTDTPSTAPSTSPDPNATPGRNTPPPPRTPPPQIDLATWPGWAQDNRLNILVVGSDSRSDEGVSDNSLRTDTMLLLSVDIQAGKAAMFSFPRNMCTPAIDGACGPVGSESRYPDWLQIPLAPESAHVYPDGLYPDMLNSLWRKAAERPDFSEFSPGIGQECAQQFNCERGWRALVGTIQEIAGQQVDGIIAVNLKGFVALVDNLPPQCPPRDVRAALTNAECYGGVWLDIPEPLHDDIYHTSTQQQIVLDIERGCQFFDGEMALAYSRSRHESSDYDRARRQQYVLTQVRKRLDPLALLPQIPALLQVAQQNLFMSFTSADFQYLAEAANRVDADRIYRNDFAPGQLTPIGSMDGIRDKVANIFQEPEPEPQVRPNDPPCPPR